MAVAPNIYPMSWSALNGKFIVFDGPDGCGKSTQVRLFKEFMLADGLRPTVLRDPGGTAIGEQIRDILLSAENENISVRCESMLYMASRCQLYSEFISPALRSGGCVICDRWISSTYAYQAVAGKIGSDWVLNLAEAALERTWPDLTVIIDLPGEKGLSRIPGPPDRIEQKPAEFHNKVRSAFLALAESRSDFRVVCGLGSTEQVQKRIQQVVADYVDA